MDQATHDELIALLPRLRRFAFGLAGSADEGDDLLQSALERALGRLDQWQKGTRLDSWMFRIVQTVWIDRQRARRRRGVHVDVAAMPDLPGGDAAHETESRLHLAAVQRCVSRLPAEQREVLMLVSVDGMSYREAADVLAIPMGTVMSRLSRARLALGRMLGEVAALALPKEMGHAANPHG
jgi:RNA polymerase sigma-70 factor (ECF subfamily)